MPQIVLNDRFVQTVKPPSQGRVDYTDTKTPSLALRITAAGRKAWSVRVYSSGRRQRVTLGNYPILSLADARDRARRLQQDVQDGYDPHAERQRRRTAITVGELLDEYEKVEGLKLRSIDERMRMLRKDLQSWLHRKAKDITRRDAVLLFDAVAGRGAVLANRVSGYTVRLFNFAVERGVLDDNPLLGLRKTRETPRAKVLSDQELRTFWQGLVRTDMALSTRLGLQLVLATGQRPGEVAGMEWSEVDIPQAVWTIPVQRLKVRGARGPHEVPLSTVTLTLLQGARDLGGEQFVLASHTRNDQWRERPVQVRSLSRALSRHLDDLGLDDRATPHDLRRTVRTRLAALGIDDIVAERVLGHRLQGIMAVYNQHSYLDEKRAALNKWGNELSRISSDLQVVGGTT